MPGGGRAYSSSTMSSVSRASSTQTMISVSNHCLNIAAARLISPMGSAYWKRPSTASRRAHLAGFAVAVVAYLLLPGVFPSWFPDSRAGAWLGARVESRSRR